MIDQDLINKCQSDLGDFGSLMKCQATELLASYIKLIEQNAELHKQSEKYKAQIKSLIQCDEMNTGYEPSLSVFQREIDLSKELVGL